MNARKPGRPPSKDGPRRTRLPEALYHEDEAQLVREVAGKSVSKFIRDTVLKEARRKNKKP